MNKLLKILGLNGAIAILAIIIYSPGLLALYPTDISILKAGTSILSGIGLLSAFGIGNLKILNPKQKLLLTTKINDFEEAKKILYSYKDGKYFGEIATTMLDQLNRLDRSIQRTTHEIERKFGVGTLSYNKYCGVIDTANKEALQNVITMANRMQLFDEGEYKRLQHYKDDNIPDDIQEKQIQLYSSNMELIKKAIAVNENLILALDTLTVEVAKPGQNDDSVLNEIEKLTQEIKYYK